MSLVSMKQGDSDQDCCASSVNPYGYGLMINLSEDQVEALGLKDNPPRAGQQVGLRAIAIISTKTEDADLDKDGDGIDVRLSLQITDLEVVTEKAGDAAAKLYS